MYDTILKFVYNCACFYFCLMRLVQDHKRRMIRFYAERIAVVSDYRKNAGGLLSFIFFPTLTIPATFAASDLELAYWWANEKISCLICRVVRRWNRSLHR